MFLLKRSVGLLILVSLIPAAAHCDDWELRRDDLNAERPLVEQGTVNLTIGQAPVRFPRYLNELGIKRIRIQFHQPGNEQKRLSIVWTGGSRGSDRFAVTVDGVLIGTSQTVDSARRPYMWYRDDFPCRLGPGSEHLLEISSLAEHPSAVEFAGIRLAAADAETYQPLCYESIASLERYERALGRPGTIAKSAHLVVFAPQEFAADAGALASLLERAYAEMNRIYGIDTVFKFSVEHYPEGHERGWGGISGAGTIGYTLNSLERFARLGTSNVRGLAGYTEEISHGFKAYYNCGGTYEALGVAVQEDIVRRLVPPLVADAFWLAEHDKWKDTHRAYIAAGHRNPDPTRYPWNVLYTRILNHLFLRLRNEYGPEMRTDFFRVIREMDYPLHRAKDTERMKTYADIFSVLFARDMRKEFTDFGIDLNADPPWGWETHMKQNGP